MEHAKLLTWAAAAAIGLAGCGSLGSGENGDAAAAVVAAHECTCGDPETDVLGCPAECCLNPTETCSNSQCTCVAWHD